MIVSVDQGRILLGKIESKKELWIQADRPVTIELLVTPERIEIFVRVRQ